MTFIKLLLAATVLLVTACAQQPQKAKPGELKQATKGAAPSAEQPFNAVLPAGPATANPYTQSPKPAVSDTSRQRFNRAQQQIHQKHWTQARNTLQALVADAPQLSGPWLNLGIVWVHLNKTDHARKAFTRALAANPNNIAAYNRLGVLERRAGHFAAAEQAYQQALSRWPYAIASHRNLGILYDIYMGKWRRALLHYQACQHLITERDGAADATLNGWIIDLQRRIAAREKKQ